MASVLIVDDHPGVRVSLRRAFQTRRHTTHEARSGEEAIAIGIVERPDVVIVDLVLPGLSGLGALAALKSENAKTIGIAISGVTSPERIASWSTAGAVQFFAKPVDVEALVRCAEDHVARSTADPGNRAGRLVGSEPRFLRALALARRIAATPVSLLIEGETGTGKELLAREVHRISGRSGPFVAVNCAAVPLSLVEAELFGTEKGAFTEAVPRPGAIERAAGGTLFLDEVGDLSRDAQGVLLRVLDQRVVQRLGGVRETPVDLRIVAATNVDLLAAVGQRRFRADLFYRLSQARIQIPPLRERLQDIPAIAASVLVKTVRTLGISDRQLSDEALALLSSHSWPGNVRELENVLTQTCLTSDGTTIDAGDLNFDVRLEDQALASVPELPAGRGLFDAVDDLKMNAERAWISQALAACHGSLSQTANRLRIDRKTLYKRLTALRMRRTNPDR